MEIVLGILFVRGLLSGLRNRRTAQEWARVPLQSQPFQVCAILLKRSGELVTREELRHKVWPEDTFVGFEQAVNTAIKKIRIAWETMPTFPSSFRPSRAAVTVSVVRCLLGTDRWARLSIPRLPLRR